MALVQMREAGGMEQGDVRVEVVRKKRLDSECILKVDLAGFFHGIGVEEKETIKHNLGFSKLSRMGLNPGLLHKLFCVIDDTENLAGVSPSNLKIVTSSLGNVSQCKTFLE